MTGLVRKATLFGVCGLFIAVSAANAFVPDPATSSVPQRIWVVTTVTAGNLPDVDGANGPTYTGGSPAVVPGDAVSNNDNTIIIKDFAGNPISNVGVHITFPCDVSLCTRTPGAPYSTTYGQTVTSGGAPVRHTLHGVTDAAGVFQFVALGSAKDGSPRLVAGGVFNSTVVTVDGYTGTFKTTSAVCLDHNGAPLVGAPSVGVTAADASAVLATALSGPVNSVRARADLNDTGAVTTADASTELGHALARLAPQSPLNGCSGLFLAGKACP